MEVFVDLLDVLLVADCTPVFILYHKYQYNKRLPNAVTPRRFYLFAVETKCIRKIN